MNSYSIEFVLPFDHDKAPESMEAVFDLLADAGADIAEDSHGYIDSDVGMDMGQRIIELTVMLDDDDDDRAVQRGMVAARTIIHAAGGPTHGWDKLTVERELSCC